jgi:Amt family ammonium transporter
MWCVRFNHIIPKSFFFRLGGIAGAFMTGLFCEQRVNPTGGFNGAFYGRPIQLWYQIAGILTAIGFAAACTAGILYPLDWIIGIRLGKEDELEGLDVTGIFRVFFFI